MSMEITYWEVISHPAYKQVVNWAMAREAIKLSSDPQLAHGYTDRIKYKPDMTRGLIIDSLYSMG